MLAAGLGGHDPAGGYRVDVLVGDRGDGDPRLVPAAYLHAAERVTKRAGTPAGLLALYGEAARVLRAGEGAPGAVAARVHDLYRRHAAEVNRVLDATAREKIAELRERVLPEGCTLRLVYDTGPPDPTPPAPPAPPPGDRVVVDRALFEVRVGPKACRLGNTVGFRLVERLSRAGGTYLPIGTLGADVWDDPGVRKNTVQVTVTKVRAALAGAGLDEVVIDGDEPGHYRLVVEPDGAGKGKRELSGGYHGG